MNVDDQGSASSIFNILKASQVSQVGPYWWRRSPEHDWFVVNVGKCLGVDASKFGFLPAWELTNPQILYGEFVGPIVMDIPIALTDAQTSQIENVLCAIVASGRNPRDLKAARRALVKEFAALRPGVQLDDMSAWFKVAKTNLATAAESIRSASIALSKPLHIPE